MAFFEDRRKCRETAPDSDTLTDLLVQADDQPPLCSRHLLTLDAQERLEGRQHLQVGGGRHVVVPPLLVEVLPACLLDGLVDGAAHADHAVLDCVLPERNSVKG
eukprot:6173554-Pleurochrysis_carterae.AAC.2